MLQYLSLPKDLCYVNAYHIIGRVKNMQSKKLVIIISMLVVASVFPIATTSVASDGSTIYVEMMMHHQNGMIQFMYKQFKKE